MIETEITLKKGASVAEVVIHHDTMGEAQQYVMHVETDTETATSCIFGYVITAVHHHVK